MHARPTDAEQIGNQAVVGSRHRGQRFGRPAKRLQQNAGRAVWPGDFVMS
jgi:hypothetical protein